MSVVHRVSHVVRNTNQSTSKENTMSDNTRTSEIMSQSFAKQLAWALRLNIGQVCTIIDRRAKNQGTPESMEQDKQKLRTLIGQLKWGYDNISEEMVNYNLQDEVDAWVGGGFTRKVTDTDVKQLSTFFNTTEEKAREMAETRNRNLRSMLAVKRAGKSDAMHFQVEKLLSHDGIATEEPTPDQLRSAGNKAYQSAFLFGNWAEMALIKDDLMYHLGEEPAQPVLDSNLEARANKVREQLVEKQAERAAEEARVLADFDVMSIAA